MITTHTDDYQETHGKPPRGRGTWAFFLVCAQRGVIREPFYPGPELSYGEAKRQALAEARRLGCTAIIVGS